MPPELQARFSQSAAQKRWTGKMSRGAIAARVPGINAWATEKQRELGSYSSADRKLTGRRFFYVSAVVICLMATKASAAGTAGGDRPRGAQGRERADRGDGPSRRRGAGGLFPRRRRRRLGRGDLARRLRPDQLPRRPALRQGHEVRHGGRPSSTTRCWWASIRPATWP